MAREDEIAAAAHDWRAARQNLKETKKLLDKAEEECHIKFLVYKKLIMEQP